MLQVYLVIQCLECLRSAECFLDTRIGWRPGSSNSYSFSMTAVERQFRFRVVLAFGLVYVFWGSTYLGIRIAIEHISPELMTGIRFPIAGVIMLAASALTGRRVRITRREFVRQGIVGILLLSVSNVVLA